MTALDEPAVLTAAPVAPPTFLGVLRNREVRAVWLADAQSSLGDQLSRIALAVLVYDRSHSPFTTALIYAVTFIPALFSGVVLGGLADRFPHRTTLVRANVLRAVLVGAMALAGLPIGALATLVILSTLVAAPFDSANSAMLPDLLDEQSYPVAASLRTITHQIAQLLGFAAGGLLLTVMAPRTALLIDAATFVIAAVLVRGAVRLRPAPLRQEHDERYLASIATGIRTVAATPKLRVLLGLAWLMGLFVIPEGLAAPYAAVIHTSTLGLGLLLAVGPAGTALGSFLFMKLLPQARRVRVIGVLAVAGGLPLVACIAAPPLVPSLVLWGLGGMCGAYLTQLMPEYVVAAPQARRGQAIGIAASGLLAVQGVGILLGGAVADRANAAVAVAVAGGAASALAALLSLRWRRILSVEAATVRRAEELSSI